MPPEVLVTHPFPEEPLEALRQHANITQLNIPAITRQELIDSLQGKECILCTITDPLDQVVIESSPTLKMISNFSVGYDHIDLEAAKNRGILVTHTPNVLTDATADLAWALLLSVSRRIVEGDQLARSGDWNGWEPEILLGSELTGKTLGIIGMGRIGLAMARRAQGFQMRLVYYSRTRLSIELEQQMNLSYRSLSSLLAESDFVSLHTPYTAETHHLIGENELSLMKRSAYLINTARGSVVDEQALIQALQTGQIAGAGLDVYEHEPQIPKELTALSSVVLTPHIGSSTTETRQRMGQMAVDGIIAYLRGEKPRHLVDESMWTK